MISQRISTRGFTLIELMVVIVIAAILLAIAVPSFDNLIRRNNVDSLQAKLAGALATARTEAASRNRVITICNSVNEANCLMGNWAGGWVIFEDNNANGAVDTGEQLIDVYRNTGDYTIESGDGASISFNSQGFTLDGTDALFTICDPEREEAYARGLYINRSGLVMKTRDGDDAGSVHDSPRTAGTDLNCP